jgi:hypothetical protein
MSKSAYARFGWRLKRQLYRNAESVNAHHEFPLTPRPPRRPQAELRHSPCRPSEVSRWLSEWLNLGSYGPRACSLGHFCGGVPWPGLTGAAEGSWTRRTVLSPCQREGSVSTLLGCDRPEPSGLLYISLTSAATGSWSLRSWNRLRISFVVISPLLLKIYGSFNNVSKSSGTYNVKVSHHGSRTHSHTTSRRLT